MLRPDERARGRDRFCREHRQTRQLPVWSGSKAKKQNKHMQNESDAFTNLFGMKCAFVRLIGTIIRKTLGTGSDTANGLGGNLDAVTALLIDHSSILNNVF